MEDSKLAEDRISVRGKITSKIEIAILSIIKTLNKYNTKIDLLKKACC